LAPDAAGGKAKPVLIDRHNRGALFPSGWVRNERKSRL